MNKSLDESKKIIEEIDFLLNGERKYNYKQVKICFRQFNKKFKNFYNIFKIKDIEDPILEKVYKIIEKELEDMLSNLEYLYRIISNDPSEIYEDYMKEDYMDEDYMSIDKVKVLLDNIKSINTNYKILELLLKLPTETGSIFIIGKNGSGKTTFADYLRKGIIDNLVVIPAQKLLYYHNIRKDDGKDLSLTLCENRNKIKYEQHYFELYSPSAAIDLFSVAIDTFINEHLCQLHEKYENKDKQKEEYIFDRLKRLWSAVYKDIEITFDPKDKELGFKKFNQRYTINSLSEGEKSALLYIIVTLLMPKNSYIVVDEPESFLNISTSRKLWNNLLEYRDDCRFIFISHNPDFISSLSRSENDIIWIKSFQYPDVWEFETIKEDLPRELLIEITGSDQDVIFCEGTYSSIDYKLYEILLGENYKIIPVGGHNTVIHYTDAYNKLELNLNEAYGIIDNDLRSQSQCKKLEEKNIKVLDVNEVEMLLLDKEIIQKVLKNIYTESKEIDDKLKVFEEKFFDLVKKKKDEIILNKIKLKVENHLETQKIEDYSSLDNIYKDLKELCSIKSELEETYNGLNKTINQILDEKNYDGLLRVCNLKGEVSKGLANNFIDSRYVEKAITSLKRDKNLMTFISNKYLNFFIA